LRGAAVCTRRYERKAEHFLAFAGNAAALICYRRLGRVLEVGSVLDFLPG
jgi:hypothetical protein